MDQIDQRLTEAELIRNRWTPVQDVVIDAIHDQLEGMKVCASLALQSGIDSELKIRRELITVMKYSKQSYSLILLFFYCY